MPICVVTDGVFILLVAVQCKRIAMTSNKTVLLYTILKHATSELQSNGNKMHYSRDGQPLARVPNLARELVNLARGRIHGDEILFYKENNFEVVVLSKLWLHAQNSYCRNLGSEHLIIYYRVVVTQ